MNQRMKKKFINVVTKALDNYKQSIQKANLAYSNLKLYSRKNTLEKLDNNIINLIR